MIADLPGAVNLSATKRRQEVTTCSCERCENLLLAHESGRGERIRTSGLYVPNVALYQAKLHPEEKGPLRRPAWVDQVKTNAQPTERKILAELPGSSSEGEAQDSGALFLLLRVRHRVSLR